MAVFPDVIPTYGSEITPVYKTLISAFDTDNEQRIAKRQFAIFDVKLKFPSLAQADARLVWKFYCSQKGSFGGFYWFAPESDEYEGLYVCTADSAATTWDLPGKSTSSRVLYENGLTKSSGFSYLTGGGQGGADRIQFTGAPAAGNVYSIDFAGILRVKCRFKQDRLPKEYFDYLLYQMGLELKGLPGA